MGLRPRLSLSFDGQCEAAFRFYAGALGGKVSLFTWGSSPLASQAPEGWADKVVHGSVSIGDSSITGSDVPAYRRPQGFSILLNVDSSDEARRTFDALSQDAEVVLSLQQTFWSASYGMLIDRFGVTWEINCQQAPAE